MGKEILAFGNILKLKKFLPSYNSYFLGRRRY